MQFVWDEDKNQINKKKHGISFETAISVFLDPLKIELYDELHSTINETRWNIIGNIKDVTVFVVETELQNDVIRIISARLAEKDEKEFYYANRNL